MDSIEEKLKKVQWLTEHAEELYPEDQLELAQAAVHMAKKVEHIYTKYNPEPVDPIIKFLGGFNFGDNKEED
jgi:hypothetical protein